MNQENKPDEFKQVEMSFGEMCAKFRKVESKGDHLCGYITFTEGTFTKLYDERSRTYGISSNNKAFQVGMGGCSIYGSCLDGTDPCARIDHYMIRDEDGGINNIQRCYCMSYELDRVAHLLKADKNRER